MARAQEEIDSREFLEWLVILGETEVEAPKPAMSSKEMLNVLRGATSRR